MRFPILSILLIAGPVLADGFDDCKEDIKTFLSDRDPKKLILSSSECLKDQIRDLVNPEVAKQSSVISRNNVMRFLEAPRFDKQLGGNGSAAASTSVSSSPSMPSVLSLAVESGAVTQSTSGMVTTIRGNGLGLARLLLGNEQFPDCPEMAAKCGDPAVPFLKSFTFGVGLDTSRESKTQAPTEGSAAATTPANLRPIALLTGGPSRVESLQFRYDFVNRRDLRDPQYWEAWKNAMKVEATKTALREAAKKAGTSFLLGEYVASDAYRTLLAALEKDLLSADTEAKVIAAFKSTAEAAKAAIASRPDFAEKARAEFAALENLRSVQDTVAREARKTLSASIEYNLLRPRDQPEQSNIRFVLAGNPFRRDADNKRVPNRDVLLSANFGIDFYNELAKDSKVGRLRDFHLSGQIDRKMKQAFNGADGVLTLAGYWQYQVDNALIKIDPGKIVPGTGIALPGDAQTLLAPKGHLGVVQGKLTLQFGDSGVKFPIAITWANRTQLIDAPEVRGNIGIAFDLDKLIFRR